MSSNRGLAKLFIEMEKSNPTKILDVIDIFDRSMFRFLESAIDSLTIDATTKLVADGKRVDIGYDIRFAAKALKKYYIIKDEDVASRVASFIEYLNLCWGDTFGPSELANKIDRAAELRKPTELLPLSEVKQLSDFVSQGLNNFRQSQTILDKSSFVQTNWYQTYFIQRAARRRAGTIKRFKDAIDDVWIYKSVLENMSNKRDLQLLKMFKVAFTFGKNNASEMDILIHTEDCK